VNLYAVIDKFCTSVRTLNYIYHVVSLIDTSCFFVVIVSGCVLVGKYDV